MYTVNKTRSQKKIAFTIFLVLLIIFSVAGFAVWYFIFRPNESQSANFSKTGGTVAVVKPATEDFTTPEFTISLPSGWEDHGKQNPFVDEVYYEYQSMIEDYTNRWLRVYVDVFPKDFEISRLVPVEVKENKIDPGIASTDCKSFDGAPKPGSQEVAQNWVATWEDIEFICQMSGLNYTGTASPAEGYGVSVTGKSGATHKYFFVYIDHNVRPDYSILTKAVESFEAL